MTDNPIAFIDLKAQRDRIRDKIDAAVMGVIDHCGFIMGKEVGEFEAQLAEFVGVKHAMGCGNGTDALQLVLMAAGITKGDAIFVPAFTFVATAEIAPLVGATPVFVDVLPDTFNMDPASLEAGIETAKAEGLTPKMVIPVDLFGQPADYPAINEIAQRHGMVVMADAAQGLGGSLNSVKAGALATWTTTSFCPAKPLGCYGDGGAVMTDDDDRAALLKSLRIHGKGGDKYDNVRVGVNSRLDTIQAAVLKEKLAIFPDELDARDRVAAKYSESLRDIAEVPTVVDGARSAWAQYTLKVDNRADVQAKLKDKGVPSVVYYPIPMNQQSGYTDYPVVNGGVPVSDALAQRVLSLPMHPYMDDETQDRIIDAVRQAIGSNEY